MADKVPIRGAYNSSNALTGLANFVSSETIGVAHGGTGIATVGSNQLVTGNGTSAMTSESNLTFDGSTLLVSGTASATSIMAADSGAALSSQNALKVILVDLTDPTILWDVQAFLARARYTSWYQELGAPPMRGVMFLLNDGSKLKWWDLDKDAAYMEFTQDSSNMLSSDLGIKDLFFLDGVIYTANGPNSGMDRIDLLADRGWQFWTGGQGVYKGNIEERNDGNALTTYRTSPAIVSMAGNEVVAMRDPLLYDEFGRPIQWWGLGTNAGACIYNPHNDAIYDWHDENRASTKQFMANGRWFFTRNQTTYTGVNYINGFGVAADQQSVIQHFNPWNSADNSNYGYASFPWDKSAVISDIAGNGDASRVFVSSDEGVCLITICEEYRMYGWNWITASYQTPYMKGTRIAAYPLNDVNDRSGRGNTLTNNNTTTFATSGPFGNTATFNGTNQYLSRTGDDAFNCGTDDFTISFYIKSTSASNPSGVEIPFSMFRGDSTDYLQFRFDTDGTTDVQVSDDGGSSVDSINGSGDLYDAKWHHIAIMRDGTTLKLYQDGILSGSGTLTNAAGSLDFQQVSVGADRGNNEFAGQMAQLSIGQEAWTENEINLEYQRMLRGLGGSTATLGNVDVKSAKVDPNTGLAAFTTAANQTEIWDIETGMRESIDATTTATINDADVRFKSGAILPEYITGRSGAIEFDGQERNVLG